MRNSGFYFFCFIWCHFNNETNWRQIDVSNRFRRHGHGPDLFKSKTEKPRETLNRFQHLFALKRSFFVPPDTWFIRPFHVTWRQCCVRNAQKRQQIGRVKIKQKKKKKNGMSEDVIVNIYVGSLFICLINYRIVYA